MGIHRKRWRIKLSVYCSRDAFFGWRMAMCGACVFGKIPIATWYPTNVRMVLENADKMR